MKHPPHTLLSSDGRKRVFPLVRGETPMLRVESLGAKGVWYHDATVRTVAEVAKHVDLSTLRAVE